MDPVPVLLDAGDTDPQAAAGLPTTLNVTVSLATDPPNTAGERRAVKTWVDVPSPARVVVPGGDSVTAFMAAVWVTVVDPLDAESDSTALTRQGPGVTVAVKVAVATPDAFVVPVSGASRSVPQPVPAEKVIGSPGTGVVPESVVTVALMVEVAAALAGILAGAALTVIA